MKDLYQKLRTFTGKNYGLYKSLSQRIWDFGDFGLEFIHVQGDPYAPASRLKFTAPLASLGIPLEWGNFPLKRLALADFLLRRISKELETRSLASEERFPVSIGAPGEEVLLRNALWVGGPSENNGKAVVEVILNVELPGDKRRVDVAAAADLLTDTVPDVLTSLYLSAGEVRALAQKSIECLEIREELLKLLEPNGLVAFVPDGAVLPRESGSSDRPKADALPFKSPEELKKTFEVCGKKISGIGIPKGITIIAGGAYHGKSTLLSALDSAVVPHIPGDGREWIVCDSSAVRIAAEPGRVVRKTRISPFVKELPFGVSTEEFNTRSASGSTSEAANLIEALEFGAHTLLIDEDASAVNFLIRDPRMRALIGEANEPLIPLSDRALELSRLGVNMVIVVGACGDYLSVADTVIVMDKYLPRVETEKAKKVVAEMPPQAKLEGSPSFGEFKSRDLLAFAKDALLPGLKPRNPMERQVKVRLRGETLQIGFLEADLRNLFPFGSAALYNALGLILLNLLQNAESEPAAEAIHEIFVQIQNVGFRKIPQGFSKEAALPREAELARALLRLENPPKPGEKQ